MTQSQTLEALRHFTPPLGWQADLIGLPYDFHGYSRLGPSCWGLGCLAWQEQADVALPTFSEKLPANPAFSTERTRAVNALIAEGLSIMRVLSQPRPMCFVQMRLGKNLTHIGLYAFGGWVVHASDTANGGAGAVVQDQIANLKMSITGFYWPTDATLMAGWAR